MLNLDFYKGEDLYSDGSIEDEILEIFKSGKDIEEVLKNDDRWAILYHLSPTRRNLLAWFPFDKNETILEIGSGCGAITELFCDKLSHVTAIELSKRRSEINDARNNKCNNLEIFVGNLNDVVIEQQFDYVSLIGVLEYTRSFIKSEDPYGDLFRKVKRWLKPGGKLLIAIENKFGLKYMAGSAEDHSGRLFDSVEGYLDSNNRDWIETFGIEEFKALLSANGFEELAMYYPHPDYKLPEVIYSDQNLPSLSSVLLPAPNYDQDRYCFFNERTAFFNIIKNKRYPFFANSFFTVASLEKGSMK